MFDIVLTCMYLEGVGDTRTGLLTSAPFFSLRLMTARLQKVL